MQTRITPPNTLWVTILLLQGPVPKRLQGYTGRAGRDQHVDVTDHHDAEEILSRRARPFEREDVDVQ